MKKNIRYKAVSKDGKALVRKKTTNESGTKSVAKYKVVKKKY